MQLTISQDELKGPVKEIAKELHLVPEESLKGETWDIDQFRKTCCGGRGRAWVRTNIFDAFPEVDYRNGGWCVAPHKTEGVKKTIIFAYEARMWVQDHFHEIDWLAK